MSGTTVQFRDWKARYLDQLERYERDEQDWQRSRTDLTKALLHLSLGPVGLDSHLDDLLDHLRVRARESADAKELAAIAQEVSKKSEAIDDAHQEHRKALLTASETLIVSLMETTLNRSLKSRLKRKLKQLRRGDPDIAAILSDCASLLRTKPEKPERQPVAEPDLTSDAEIDKVRAALRSVRANLKVPERLASQATAADRLIESNQLVEQLPATLNSLGQLTARCSSYEEDRMRSFIKRITAQFEELEAAILKSIDPEIMGLDAHDQFEQDIEGGVQTLRDAMTEAPDVEVLSELVSRQTETLLNVVKSFRVSEGQRRARFEASITLLKDRLRNSKRECSELSQELAVLRKHTDMDPLTGLPNRGALQARLQQDYDLCVRHGAPVSLMLIDLDYFKKINDSFGHQAGDRVLVEVAELFKSKLRKSDFAARYGGEEFVLVLPQTDLEKAASAAEKLRLAVAKRVFLFKGKRVEVTFSAGVAQLAAKESIATWLKRADAALYEAKHAGRNQIQAAAQI